MQSQPAPAIRLAFVALAIAVMALLFDGYLLFRTPSSAAGSEPQAAGADPGSGSGPSAQTVEERLNAFNDRLLALESGRAGSGPASDGGRAPERLQPPPVAPSLQIPLFASFTAPVAALKVTQSENGAITVENTDPKLTGESFVIKAKMADGSETELTVTAPAVHGK